MTMHVLHVINMERLALYALQDAIVSKCHFTCDENMHSRTLGNLAGNAGEVRMSCVF